MFTLSVFGIDNRIYVKVCLEIFCLYEHATGVKLEFLTRNHSESDQSNIKDDNIHKTEKSFHFWHNKSPIEPRVHPLNLQ